MIVSAKDSPAHGINLGAIEDVGYVAEQGEMQQHFDDRQWIGINDYVLTRSSASASCSKQPRLMLPKYHSS